MNLEIETQRTTIRNALPEDLPRLAAWPPYPWPYTYYNLTAPEARSVPGKRWWQRLDEPARWQYTVLLRGNAEVIGLYVFLDVDAAKGAIGNMGARIHPDFCAQGYGRETLTALLKGLFDCGVRSVRFDVEASNTRAVRCYEKCGLKIVGESWQEHRGGPIDPDDPKWAFALPHSRREGDTWMSRCYWMEIHAP